MLDYCTIPLTKGKVALIDFEDYERVSKLKWHAGKSHNTWYASHTAGKWPHQKRILLHRFILNCPAGVGVDHANLDGLDCRRDNIRLATDSQNMANRRKKDGCSSQFKGVFWVKKKSRWRSQIQVDNRGHKLGYFTSEIDAAIAYNAAAVEAFGEFARLNPV